MCFWTVYIHHYVCSTIMSHFFGNSEAFASDIFDDVSSSLVVDIRSWTYDYDYDYVYYHSIDIVNRGDRKSHCDAQIRKEINSDALLIHSVSEFFAQTSAYLFLCCHCFIFKNTITSINYLLLIK